LAVEHVHELLGRREHVRIARFQPKAKQEDGTTIGNLLRCRWGRAQTATPYAQCLSQRSKQDEIFVEHVPLRER
jgi:hypothetical protein